MHLLPAWKSSPTCAAPSRENPCTIPKIFTYSRGFSWSSTTFSRFQVPVDLCRQIYSLARSISSPGYLSNRVHLPCSTGGLHGWEFQQLSRETEEHNLPPPCGQPSVPCWVSSPINPQLFILKPMGWSRGSTDNLKTLYELGWQLLIGTVIYHGFS